MLNGMAAKMKKKNVFGDGIRRICAVAAASTATRMAELVLAGLRETPTIEVRLDWLRGDAERIRFLDWLKRHKPRGSTFLATCRRREGGGRFPGTVEAELRWLARARDAGCDWCDLEIETLRHLRGKSLRNLGLPVLILLSVHDFNTIPARLGSFRSRSHTVGDAVKIAANASTICESTRLLDLTGRIKKLVVVPMGQVGLPARILALRSGSALAYAPIGEATAPGQVSLHDLKHLYRAHELNNTTGVYGVIGDPVGQSLSPLLHNTGFIEAKLNAVYLPFLVKNLLDFLKAAPEFGIRGFSVTIPHKQSILQYSKECDPLAAEIGAVNTVVVRHDGSLFGCNTDYIGILRALERKLELRGSRILIFGAGGAARAAAFALAKAGAHVVICARRGKAAKELAGAVGGETVPQRALKSEKFDAILNATPIGMHPHDKVSPLTSRELNCRIVMDLINRPQETQLLKIARREGIVTIPGVEMFLPQGFAQWELWTGQRAPERIMREAILKALRSEGKSHQHA
jgi:3-dehydroquinate dehydratase/shikimate dehydrogenase